MTIQDSRKPPLRRAGVFLPLTTKTTWDDIPADSIMTPSEVDRFFFSKELVMDGNDCVVCDRDTGSELFRGSQNDALSFVVSSDIAEYERSALKVISPNSPWYTVQMDIEDFLSCQQTA